MLLFEEINLLKCRCLVGAELVYEHRTFLANLWGARWTLSRPLHPEPTFKRSYAFEAFF